ncbi:MAG: MAPEG family protein [Myxococcota bacterium]
MEDPAYSAWALASLVVVLKTMGVGVYTSVLRVRARTYASPEDHVRQGHPDPGKRDPEVERARRIHRNDLENGLPFFVVGAIYAATDPSPLGLAIAFVGFPVARIAHTWFYATGRMPHRTYAYAAGFFITVWMALASGAALLWG